VTQIKICIKCECAFGWNIEEVFDVQESTELKTLNQNSEVYCCGEILVVEMVQ